MQKILNILLIFSAFITSARAEDDVRFTARAPQTVVLDEPFMVVYEVNATGKDFRAPEFNNFDNLSGGPFTSTSQQLQIINGKQSSSVTVSYTFTLQAQKTGTFSISPASITVKGEKYSSNGLQIKVLPADSKPKNQQHNQSAQGSDNNASQSVSSENIFIKTQISKTAAYEQEAILLTYKLYTTLDVTQCPVKKMPDFNGFMRQDLEQQRNVQASYENIDGKNYLAYTLYQTLLYPQQSGAIKIDPANFEAVVQVPVRRQSRSIFDDIFGGGGYSSVSKNLTAPAVTVNVKKLPDGKPASFGGAVGQFDLKSSISATQIKANEAVTLKLIISGAGNMKMIKTPEIDFPTGFEPYDPKVANNFKTSVSGVSGNKTIEYLFIPREAGNYEIAPVEFCYFDTRTNTYKTLTTNTFNLQVGKGDGAAQMATVSGGNYVAKEEVKQLGSDIRYIVTDKIKLEKQPENLFGTLTGWLMYAVPLFIAFVLFFVFRKNLKDNADLRLVRNRRANKMAVKRLKLAKRLLSEGKKDLFYEEVLKSLWNYLSDKLGISVAELTKEKVESQMHEASVSENLIQNINKMLSECEFARFAPATSQTEMGNLYDEAISLISALENVLKKQR